MTEMLLACCWIWAAYVLLVRGHRTAGILIAAFLLGLGGLMRPEGWIAIAVFPFALFLWLRVTGCRRLRLILPATLAAILPTLCWYLLGAFAFHDLRWVVHYWPWSPKSQYGSRTFLFLVAALVSMALWLWIPITIALRDLFKSHRPSKSPGWQSGASTLAPQKVLLLALPLLAFFLLHAFLGAFGLFGSMSLPRYFICVAPMAAILAVLGMIHLESARPDRLRTFRTLAIACPSITLAILICLGLLPSWPLQNLRSLDVAIAAIKHRLPADQFSDRLILAHPYAILQLGLPYGTPADIRSADPSAIQHAPPGTILVLDEKLWTDERRPSFAELTAWGWQEDQTVARNAAAASPFPFPITYFIKGQAHLWIKTR